MIYYYSKILSSIPHFASPHDFVMKNFLFTFVHLPLPVMGIHGHNFEGLTGQGHIELQTTIKLEW